MKTEYEWTCPFCGTKNTDDYALTIFPVCEGCGTDNWWEDLLTPEQIEEANSIIDAEAEHG